MSTVLRAALDSPLWVALLRSGLGRISLPYPPFDCIAESSSISYPELLPTWEVRICRAGVAFFQLNMGQNLSYHKYRMLQV